MERNYCRLTKTKVCLCFVKVSFYFIKGNLKMLRIQSYDFRRFATCYKKVRSCEVHHLFRFMLMHFGTNKRTETNSQHFLSLTVHLL